MEAISYENKYFRIIAAFGATILILFHDRPFDLQYALTTSAFYPAFMASFLVATLIVFVVHYITRRLDKNYPWNRDIPERFLYQVCLGFVTPAAIDFSFFFLYFLGKGENIMSNDFIAGDFWYVVLLLLSLNSYYGLYAAFYFWRMRIKVKRNRTIANGEQAMSGEDEKVPPQPESTDAEFIVIKYKRTQVYLHPEDMYCLYKSGNYVRIITVDKKNYTTPESINSLEARFQARGLFRINRDVMVNQEIVEGYRTGLARDTLMLILKYKYRFVDQSLNQVQLTVTKERIKIIKEVFPLLSRNEKKSQEGA